MSFNKLKVTLNPLQGLLYWEKMVLSKLSEEGLRKWFQSKSKDGKRGWVDVVDGDACAREKVKLLLPSVYRHQNVLV